jgi:septum formation protein
MAEKKIPSDAPPDYEQAAAEHIAGPRPAGSAGPRRPIPPPDIPIIKHLNSRRVILASASPQRKNLLQQVSFLYSPGRQMACNAKQ